MSSEQLLYQLTDVVPITLTSQGIVIRSQLQDPDSSISSSFTHRSRDTATYYEHDSNNCNNSLFSDNLAACFACLETKEEGPKVPRFISYKNILYVEPRTLEWDSNELKLTYVVPNHQNYQLSATKVSINTLNIQVQNCNPDLQQQQQSAKERVTSIIRYILNKSYRHRVMQQPSILVLINPHGGQGKAVKIYNEHIKPILQAAHCKITYQNTEYSGHAYEIARDLDIDQYDIIVCCSGDGIPHEVINGFYQRPDSGVEAFNNVIITQLPCGSGNALTLSTLGGSNHPEVATWLMLKSEPCKMDLMAVTQGTGENMSTKLSFLSQCYGIIADSDIGTEHLRWLGPVRFEIGVLQKVISGATYPCDLYVNYYTYDKYEIKQHVSQYVSSLERRGITSGSDSSNSNGGGNNNDDLLYQVTLKDLKINSPNLDQPVPSTWEMLPSKITENLNILYVGKMPYVSKNAQFFPAALPNDGYMDMIITDSHRTSMVNLSSILLNVESGTHINDDKVVHAKVNAYRLVPRMSAKNHYISIDGESFPFEKFQVEVLPKIMTGLLLNGKFTESALTK
ncbi:LCB4 [Candida oxycetoniae]|uniref:LCB4 n=1 Tax=Candida oxycetoniae TaxID=497107 RepID=A0AAI9SVW9_9ASCO|nr:LCB4 [Candida oxycetoniae]KAI3404058.2 LCB4 [Candida oxycetoniae]